MGKEPKENKFHHINHKNQKDLHGNVQHNLIVQLIQDNQNIHQIKH